MTADYRIDGHRALVAGAGRGLGRAIADALDELGAVVHGTSRDPASAEQIAERYGTAALVLDLADIGSFPGAVDTVGEPTYARRITSVLRPGRLLPGGRNFATFAFFRGVAGPGKDFPIRAKARNVHRRTHRTTITTMVPTLDPDP